MDIPVSPQEVGMRRGVKVLTIMLAALACNAAAQQSNSKVSLTDQQVLGRRIFQQRCAVCHTQPLYKSRRYGPALYKNLVEGNEDTMRNFIMDGSRGRMPGFRYGLQPAEVSAIIEYLKSVPKPAPQASGGDEGPLD
jgi:mono/diheme cytochrome c family protein